MSLNLPAHPDADKFIIMNEVMEMYVKSTPIPRIAKEMKLTQKEVKAVIAEWRETAVGGAFLKDRVTELLAVLDEHFSKLLEEIWNTIEEINGAMISEGVSPQLIAQRISALKVAAELDTKRVDTLQKAGLLEAADLGDEIAEMEEEHAKLIKILQDVTGSCPNCRMEIANRLSDLTGQAVSVERDDDIEGEVVV